MPFENERSGASPSTPGAPAPPGALAGLWQWLLERWRAQLRSKNVHYATWTFTAKTVQLIGRFGYFAVVAHVLGPKEYGSFIACTALIAIMTPFASFGTGSVMFKNTARDRNSFRPYFGNAILVTLSFAMVLTLFAAAIRSMVLPASATLTMLMAVGISDLVGTQLTAVCQDAFNATAEFRRYTQLAAWSTGARFVASIILALTTRSAQHWAYLYAGATLLAALGAVLAVGQRCGWPRLDLKLVVPSLREGFHFSTSLASQSVYNDIDKTMLARLSSVEAAAIYAVAYRFIDGVMLPIVAVTAVTYADFFRRGAGGVTPAFEYALPIIKRSWIYGAMVAVAMLLGAGLVPLIMGHAYAESATALRWLCLLPAAKSVHAFLSNTLTGAGYQWQRSTIQIIVALFNILINFWVIRAFAWRGAAVSSIVTDFLLAALLYVAIRWHLRRERQSDQERIAAAGPVLASSEQ